MRLKGKTIINTQQKSQNQKLNQILQNEGANVLSLPCIKTITLFTDNENVVLFHQLKDFDWLIFTSKNGVSSFFEILNRINSNLEQLKQL